MYNVGLSIKWRVFWEDIRWYLIQHKWGHEKCIHPTDNTYYIPVTFPGILKEDRFTGVCLLPLALFLSTICLSSYVAIMWFQKDESQRLRMPEQKYRRIWRPDVLMKPHFQPRQQTSRSLVHDKKKTIKLHCLTTLWSAFNFYYSKIYSLCDFCYCFGFLNLSWLIWRFAFLSW